MEERSDLPKKNQMMRTTMKVTFLSRMTTTRSTGKWTIDYLLNLEVLRPSGNVESC